MFKRVDFKKSVKSKKLRGSPTQKAKYLPVLLVLFDIDDSHREIDPRRKPHWLCLSGVLKFQINSDAWQGCRLSLASLAFCEIALILDFMHLYV